MRSVSTALAFANVMRHAGGGVGILVNVELLALGADFLWLSARRQPHQTAVDVSIIRVRLLA